MSKVTLSIAPIRGLLTPLITRRQPPSFGASKGQQGFHEHEPLLQTASQDARDPGDILEGAESRLVLRSRQTAHGRWSNINQRPRPKHKPMKFPKSLCRKA